MHIGSWSLYLTAWLHAWIMFYEWTEWRPAIVLSVLHLGILYVVPHCFPLSQIKFNSSQNKLRHIYSSRDDTQPLLYSQIIDLVLIFYDVLVTRPLYNLYAHAFEIARSHKQCWKKSWLRIGKDTIGDPMRPNGVASDDL